jgi:4-hydroxy-tetrahydrodipicolinate reductase
MTVRIGIAGITGRMGRLLVEEAQKAGVIVAGGISRSGQSVGGLPSFNEIGALTRASDLVVDFTAASTVQAHAAGLVRAGKGWVLGTSGLSAEDEKAVAEAARHVPVVYAANFSAGVNLVLALAERMGTTLPADRYDAEILEMHHRQKIDAPSGTAIAIGRAVAKGRGVPLETAMLRARDGHTGPRPTGAIGFAALRGGQVVGEHSLIFAAGDEHVILTHRAFDRRTFAAGAIRAALWAADKPPGLYGMSNVLGMT